MRNLVYSAIAYAVSLLTVFWCMMTFQFGLIWYTVGALVFGYAVVFCLSDLAVRLLDRLADREEDEEEILEEGLENE